MTATRVLVDLLGFTGSRGGTETYAREILTRLPAALPDAVFAAVVGRSGADRVREFFPGRVHELAWVGADSASWAAGAVAGTEIVARRNRADLIWAPANFGPILHGVPRAVTVHDAIYDEVPGRIGERFVRAGTSFLMGRSARSADEVLTVSAAAAASIQRHLSVAGDRITVVHNGSSTPRPVPDPWSLLERWSIPRGRPLVLSTGNRMPHKNFDGLLRGIAHIPRDQRPLTIIAGSRLPDPLADTVHTLGLADDVLLPGWVTDDELEALFQVADLYVCPSLAEGFGLPVVDALRRGVAVVANDIPVLREVGGDHVAYVDARSPDLLAAAVARALDSPPASAARRRAVAHAETFTWDAAAEGTAAVLARIADRGRPGR
jgi:glycosyltransferase involved in cell wall biosynthesis